MMIESNRIGVASLHRAGIAIAFAVLLCSVPALAAGRKVAVLVGVEEYQKPSFTKLRYSEDDVRAVHHELQKLGFESKLVVGPDATRAKIMAVIDRTVSELGADDLILVMMAGHGQQLKTLGADGIPSEDSFFCPVDGVAGAADTLYSLSMLLDEQLIPNVGRRILIVDACRDVPDDVGRGIQGNAMITLPEDTAIFFSCRSGQRSYEHADLKHGIFTHSLLEGLRGGAAREGKIVYSQLVSYVDWMMAKDQLRRYMPADAPQVPITAGGVPYAVLGQGQWSDEPSAPQKPQPEELKASFLNSIGMKFQRIPPGVFSMGSAIDQPGRKPDEFPHLISISREFFLAAYEVSQSEYRFVMQSNPSYFRIHGDGQKDLQGQLPDQLPVEQVTWDEANEFCRRLSRLPAETASGRRYRLPTEAEWEYACRAGTETAFFFGDQIGQNQVNGDGRFPYGTSPRTAFLRRTCDVAMFRPNAFGLYNLSGNVAEWCQDWYDADYYRSSHDDNPTGPITGSERVLRGGSWFDGGVALRSSNRQSAAPTTRLPFHGFRVVCEVR
ncbi:Serine/threonine-protein kinase pkn1 [Stieleria maiorica]|uniref:Serine/threonine-protein kinase pkn1 n=2 Tax=Stieleria maiorica TaxID=2795974 RepID=A0A5B9MNV2_9BACT|nr:Serine/threonine-protein kinase pkn1 [Stieleria maiorica]